jgi:aspartate aminotransferase-like enzyme
MTPSTPSVAHIHALESKLDDIFSEGLEQRFARHLRTNALVHDWVRARGFEFFAEDGYRSVSLTCVKNNREINVAQLVRDLRTKHHLVIDGGYGNIKARRSASRTWATRRKRRCRISSPRSTTVCPPSD